MTGTEWAQYKASGTQYDSGRGWVRERLEPKASQLALGLMTEFALNLKPMHCRLGAQGHLGRTVAQRVALRGLTGRRSLKKRVRFSTAPLKTHFALEVRCFPGAPTH